MGKYLQLEEQKYSKGKNRWIIALLTIFLLIFLVIGILIAQNYKHIGNLIKVVSLIDQEYLLEVDSTKLVDGAINGLVDSLGDPYSVYLDEEDNAEIQEMIQGSFGGLGVLIGVKDDLVAVFHVYDDTPAKKGGILDQDVILEIDDEAVDPLDLDGVAQKIKGEIGTEVSLTIKRESLEEPFKVKLAREEINIPSVEGKMLENGIGYIAIYQFTTNTPLEFDSLLLDLKKQDLKGIVLDLRDNPGGELFSVVNIAGHFVPKGPIVYIEDKYGNTETLSSEGDNLNLPLVVLVNGGSASASEILSGAIKDTEAGLLVGETTYGKGLVQTVFELGDNTGIKLTTACYLTPDKHDINKKGIEPNEKVLLEGEEDTQLNRALEILNERLLAGEGE